ncbi:MAG TPA: FecR domain-containing protein [Candidatus Sulfotelmatobacter sp.]|nr:FecR domain-containing protein [Candidatus Sulfotelmatobacter sp.]
MKDEQFDRLLSTIRNEEVPESALAQASDRVWKSITGNPDSSSQALRTCNDFQQLIPGYLAKQLSPARALLFEDHVHACVTCRHALERKRDGEQQQVWHFRAQRTRFPFWRWTMAVATVAAVIVVAFSISNGLFPGQHPVRAAVQNVDGSLYAVDGDTAHIIPAGYEIRNSDEVRTAKGSTAVVRLIDGSLVEMGERADLSVSRQWKGTTIHLQGGQIIVQAAKQRSGHLYVATDDGLVSVKGTIFSVNHGVKGSRVAVIEGVVHVDFGNNTTDLTAGQQATSSPSVSKVPIQNEIAWSRNSAKYLALLGEFSILQKQFAAIPGPGLRYSSDLLPLIPENTVVYASIPNLANTIGEANQIFNDRLQQSPELSNWWRQQQKGNGPRLNDVLDRVKTFSSYLGDEIAFAIGKQGTDYSAPVVLARVRQPGLEDFLQSETQKLASNQSQTPLYIVHNAGSVVPQAGHPLLVYINNGLLIATPDSAELQRTVQRAQSGSKNIEATPFYQHIAQSYEQGVEWLFCADMEQIVAKNVQADSSRHDLPPGIGDVRYLTLEHREIDGKPESRADLMFASQRQGIASWLAAPASMGSLEFVSPEASMVTSAVIKNPRSIMEEIFKMIGSGDANFSQNLADFQSKTGVNVLDDLAAPLGGEVTMAFDGPMVPTPRWKLIFEVYDPTTLQSTIEKLINNFNQEAASHGHSVQLTKKEINSRTYYAISSPNGLNAEIDYTFVDSYLIAAPDIATISHAIQGRETGYTLPHSSTFKALVPTDSYTNFSAIFYHNLGPVVGPLVDEVKSTGALTPQQRQSIDALTANSAPGLIYAYGQPNSIIVASNTGFMGFDLGTLLTMGHNGPFLPQMLLGGTPHRPTPQTQ